MSTDIHAGMSNDDVRTVLTEIHQEAVENGEAEFVLPGGRKAIGFAVSEDGGPVEPAQG